LGDTHKSVRHGLTEECVAVHETLARVGDKWTVMVVGVLSRGTLRYSEIRRAIDGISQRMLTLTLKGLEEDGLVRRTVHPTVPPKVEYELTKLGRSLRVPLNALHEWTLEHRPAMLEARKAYAKKARTKAKPSSADPGTSDAVVGVEASDRRFAPLAHRAAPNRRLTSTDHRRSR
jgi:DNA-binding HxlR family transcriptional regulator